MQDIRKDPLLEFFFEEREQSESTRKGYSYHFLNYYKATGLTPSKAIEEADEDEKLGLKLSRRRIRKRQIEYRDYLKKRNASPASIKQGLTMIRSFYSANDIILPKPPAIKPENNDQIDTTNELPGLEEIKKAFMKSKPLYQSIIVLMASSGMGRAEIMSLTIHNLLDALNSLDRITKFTLEDLQDIPLLREKLPTIIGPLQWTVQRVKMRHTGRGPYCTFSTPESLDYILRYMEMVRPKPETIEEKIFLNRDGNPITDHGFDDYFRSLNRRCGWGLKGKQAYFRSHSLRKWFANKLENTSLGYNNTNRLLGHEPLNKTDASYFKANPEVMKSLYYDNMDAVTLFSKIEVHDKTDERVAELEAQIEQMRKANEEMARSIQQMAIQNQQPKP